MGRDLTAILRRVAPDREPIAVERPTQGNNKTTAVARFADGPALVVQTSDDPTAMATEAALLAAIGDRTAAPVPPLVASGRLGAQGYLVTELVTGRNLHERFVGLPSDRRRAIARRFGAILAQLHEGFPFPTAGPVTVDADGALVAGGRSPGEWFRSYVAAGMAALPAAFDDLRPEIAAATEPPSCPHSPVLFPWDLRPGNALVDEDGLAAALDWGDPRAADPALSVAKTEHLVARWYGIETPALESAFRSGYESVRPLPDVPRAYRVAAVLNAAVDSNGTVTRPHYPERDGSAAVAVHRKWLSALVGDEGE